METKSSPLIAVDTNVLYDWAGADAHVLDAIQTIRAKIPNAVLIITSTVIEELAFAVQHARNPETQKRAIKAGQNLLAWGIQPRDFAPVGHGITEKVAERIREAGLLPKAEVNDSFIIAEAALANCRLLISSDSHLKDIDQKRLGAILARCDVATPVIVSPYKIVHDFFPKR